MAIAKDMVEGMLRVSYKCLGKNRGFFYTKFPGEPAGSRQHEVFKDYIG